MTSRKKTESTPKKAAPLHSTDPAEIQMILDARHSDPYGFLGLQCSGTGRGLVIRSFQPRAKAMVAVVDGQDHAMEKIDAEGFFEVCFPDQNDRFDYQLKIIDHDGNSKVARDVYQFPSTIGDQDIHYFTEGSHRRLWRMLGAHLMSCRATEQESGQTAGTRFSVWAPNAWRVSVVGDFNNWDGRINPMRNRNGVWEIFLPEVGVGAHYKFEIIGKDGALFTKSDPHAFFSQNGIDTASLVYDLNQYGWSDDEWMKKRESRDHYHNPISIYEVHLGSWKRRSKEKNRFLSYLEFATELVDYVVEMGFTHIELMPVSEFPFNGSWGYQVCGYYAPTSRFGSPDELRNFVDSCHQRGIGVIMDWVPAHFPKDAHGLARFDGTALYEHEDPRQGEHEDWGTLIYNYSRNEVRNFLVANALYWLKEYHIDGIRVDAVASMLYLDYSREEGQWIPNEFGGRENLGAIEFLKNLNASCYEECPGIITIAEESTAFPGVSRPIDKGGLGFGFKWNMGWMNDSLNYMSKEPIYRKFHHNEATFSMIYAYHENYILVLSHDEVVHGKGSMINKMPGDKWQKLANLRMFYGWMYAHPGKKLLFQGDEFAQPAEWDHDKSIDWQLLENDEHLGVHRSVKDLNHLYISEAALYETDHDPKGFEWIMQDDAENSVFAFARWSQNGECIVVLVNATPVIRNDYRIGVPGTGFYEEIFNSDAEYYGGANSGNAGGIPAEIEPSHGREQSIVVQLPPLATVYFKLRQV
ncbi:MAG: 1,4-alpha-glucan branching protein GlgB [Verrucomicrobiales bacterium]|nr:1,4-alpha-glucan branching protein GlgB [Verrucomicrobiales bacterium]